MMNESFAFMMALGLMIYIPLILNVVFKLFTKHGRLQLESWWTGNYVDTGGNFLIKYDFFGVPTSFRVKSSAIRKSLLRMRQKNG